MVSVSNQGVLGKIIHVTEHTSELMLLTDELAAVVARVLPGGYLSIVNGQGANASTLKLSLLPGTAEIKIGDKVVTSGLSDLYPEGLTIGFITKIDANKTGMYQTAEVEPTVRATSLYEVMILSNFQSAEQPVISIPEEATP